MGHDCQGLWEISRRLVRLAGGLGVKLRSWVGDSGGFRSEMGGVSGAFLEGGGVNRGGEGRGLVVFGGMKRRLGVGIRRPAGR
jgi:hypothetical protein